jgi:hypothetical protein
MGCWGSCAALVERNRLGRVGRWREVAGGEEMAGGQRNGEAQFGFICSALLFPFLLSEPDSCTSFFSKSCVLTSKTSNEKIVGDTFFYNFDYIHFL